MSSMSKPPQPYWLRPCFPRCLQPETQPARPLVTWPTRRGGRAPLSRRPSRSQGCVRTLSPTLGWRHGAFPRTPLFGPTGRFIQSFEFASQQGLECDPPATKHFIGRMSSPTRPFREFKAMRARLQDTALSLLCHWLLARNSSLYLLHINVRSLLPTTGIPIKSGLGWPLVNVKVRSKPPSPVSLPPARPPASRHIKGAT